MKKLLSVVLIFGFLFTDFLFFHDIFKPGEVTTLAQYLTGVLSLPVIFLCLQAILQRDKHVNN